MTYSSASTRFTRVLGQHRRVLCGLDAENVVPEPHPRDFEYTVVCIAKLINLLDEHFHVFFPLFSFTTDRGPRVVLVQFDVNKV